jgi:hypothetical protein
MKTALIISSLSILLFTACESTDDRLNEIDHTVPVVQFESDTLEVTAGDKATINAVVKDDSGIQRIEFSYGDWRINKITDLTLEANTVSYPFSLEITVPADAARQWEESLYFKDASSIKITQQYHRLALTAWDRNRNLVKGYVFVRVK